MTHQSEQNNIGIQLTNMMCIIHGITMDNFAFGLQLLLRRIRLSEW